MMMHNLKRAIVPLAVFVLPLLLVKLSAVMLGRSGPAEANSSSTAVTPSELLPLGAGRKPWSKQQRAAARHVDWLRTQPFGATPLYYEVTETPPDNGGSPTPVRFERPHIVLQAVMTSPTGNVALIDAKRYRAGDRLAGSVWIIGEINGATRSITLVHPPTGRTEVVEIRLPR